MSSGVFLSKFRTFSILGNMINTIVHVKLWLMISFDPQLVNLIKRNYDIIPSIFQIYSIVKMDYV